MNRVLETLGYDGPVKLTTRVPRVVLLYGGELRQFARPLARARPVYVAAAGGGAGENGKQGCPLRRLMGEVVRRSGKALQQCQDVKLMARTAEKMKGVFVRRAG